MPPAPSPPNIRHFNEPFISALDAAAPANAQDDPNYYARYPRSLVTTSNVDTFVAGTGSAIFDSLTPLLESTDHELILVTCFWARSASLDALNQVLVRLSDKAVRRGTEKIRVRLCFSSSSLFRKLFHKQTVVGQIYPASSWVKTLGLPDPSNLGGLDLVVRSIFILPFSVMHPKFVVIDRKSVVLPSCNISWEEWFEGALTFNGPVVEHFLRFFSTFWERRPEHATETGAVQDTTVSGQVVHVSTASQGVMKSSAFLVETSCTHRNVHTVFLPSPHRRNPRFRPFVSANAILAPPTPLNTFVLTLFAKAEKLIRIQSPNITAPPVLSALVRALARGVDVRILTSERLMILEQLVTSGTTTSRCMRKLVKRYRQLCSTVYSQSRSDEEAAISPNPPGLLHIAYFEPTHGPRTRGKEAGQPQQSHLKMMVIDDEVLVLGSGNLDRASWFTSQELGVAFFNGDLARQVCAVVDKGMHDRSKTFFAS